MNPSPLNIEMTKLELQGLMVLIDTEIQTLEHEHYHLKPLDFVNLKMLHELKRKFQNKVQRHHLDSKVYKTTIDKAHAWIMLIVFNPKTSEVHPTKRILGNFHQKLI